MIQPTVSSTEVQQLVSAPGTGSIPPGQDIYKVKWSKYNFKEHLHSTIKSKVLGGLRSKPDPVDQPERTAHYDCAVCIDEMLHNTIAQRQFC